MILINVQPTESTVARVDARAEVPPSLVITDGNTTVWISPHDSNDGPLLAAEFGARLADCAHHWGLACRSYQDRDPDPNWLDPAGGSGGRRARR